MPANTDALKMQSRGNKMKALILLLMCSPVLADDLVYQSQTLSGTATTYSGSFSEGSTPINEVYTITVTVSGPLAPNLNYQVITPSGWTVTGPGPLSSNLTSSNPNVVVVGAAAAVFVFSTDATGKITNWIFAISGNSTTTVGGEFANSQNASFSSSSIAGDTAISSFMVINRYVVDVSGPAGTWTQPSPSSHLEVRTCTSSWAPPSNTMGSGIAPNADGSGEECGRPIYFPSSWYIRTTTDGGKTSEWQTLASLGLGKAT